MVTASFDSQISSILCKLGNLAIGNYSEVTQNTKSKSASTQAKQIRAEFISLMKNVIHEGERPQAVM